MPVEVEKIVNMPVVNPETGYPSRSFIFMGALDRRQGDKIIDWKGTSRPDRTITQLTIGYQAELYALASGNDVLEIEYRLIQRPGLKYIRPKCAWAVVKEGRKTAIKVCETQEKADEHIGTLQSTEGVAIEERYSGDVTRQNYEERCWDQLLQEPQRMVSHNYLVTPAKLEQARHYLWECSKRILDSRRHSRWIPNTGACFAYERPCPYLPLCEAVQEGAGWETLAQDEFRDVGNSHPELGDVVSHNCNFNRDILTYSSLCDLASCETFYHWKHEQRLAKQREEDSEPLWVGSAMHRGVAGYAEGGLDAAMAAVEAWAVANPVLGEDAAWRQDEQVGRARAMIRAAAVKWPESGEPT